MITIIVLLILAGVTISTLTGDNSILNQVSTAKEQTLEKGVLEQINLAIIASKANENAKLDPGVLENELRGYFGDDVTGDSTKGWTVKSGNNTYKVSTDGTVKSTDLREILEDANSNPEKYKHSQQETSTYIGIGTNGEPVNMDLWSCGYVGSFDYAGNTDDSHYDLAKSVYVGGGNFIFENAYLGSDFDNIVIPQYIKGEGDEYFKEVTNLTCTFSECTSLTTAPEIPSSVIDMSGTFDGCTSLTTAPEIPSSVIDMERTFSGCTSLTTAPEIPSSVIDVRWTFDGCTSLTTAPEIPSSVIDMEGTFSGCTSLTTAPEIPSSVINMEGTFRGCTSLTTAPMIPSGVNNMIATFKGCTNLTGTIIINANPTFYVGSSGNCFEDTVKSINLIGDSSILQELANTANNGNVEVSK